MKLPNIRELSLGEQISSITIILILLGFFNFYSYYSLFGIDITSYLEPSEIIFSFSSLFVAAVLLVGGFSIYYVLQYLTDLLPVPKVHFMWKMVMILMILTVFMLTMSFGLGGIIEGVRVDPMVFLFLFFAAIALMFISAIVKNITVVLFSAFLILLTLMVQKNKADYRAIVERKIPKYDVSISFGDKTIRTDSTFFYIGATRRFIYFWSADAKNSVIYPMERIDHITSKESEYENSEEKNK